MKILFTILSLMIASMVVCQAQTLPVDSKTGKITYLEVVDAAGLTAKDLFKVAKDWGTSKGFTIKKEDEATGELVFEGSNKSDFANPKGKPENATVNFSLFVFLKEGKYRYILTDFVHTATNPKAGGGKLESPTPVCGAAGMTSATWVSIKKKTQSSAEALIADLKRVIKETQNDPTKKSDW
jgi:hypothetical protein